jgi:hypothetical protein
MGDIGRYREVWKRDGVIPERYGEMPKGNSCENTGRSMGDTESFWGDTGKSGGNTERFGVGGPGDIEKVHGDAEIFGGTPGEDTGRFGRSRRRSGMNGSLWEVKNVNDRYRKIWARYKGINLSA